MPEQAIQKTTFISQLEIDQLLAQGILLTMEDDLREFQGGKGKSKKEPDKSLEPSAKKREDRAIEILKEEERMMREEAIQQEEFKRQLQDREKQAQMEEEEKKKEEEKARLRAEAKTREEERMKQEEQKREEIKKAAETEQEHRKVESARDEAVAQAIRAKANEEAQRESRQERQLMKEIKERARVEAEKKGSEIELQRQKDLEEKTIENKQREEAQKKLADVKKGSEEELKSALTKQDEAKERERYKKELEDSQRALTERLNSFAQRFKPLEAKRLTLIKEREAFLQYLSSVVNKENAQTAKKKEVERREMSAVDAVERHRLEKIRWDLEEQLREIEKEKWNGTEKLQTKEKELKALEESEAVVFQERKDLEQKLADVNWKLREISLKVEQKDIIDALNNIVAAENKITQDLSFIEGSAKKLDEELAAVVQEEKDLELQDQTTEEQEKQSVTPSEEKRLEQVRWQIEDQRKAVEQKRWSLEVEKQSVRNNMEKLKVDIGEVLNEKNKLERRLAEVNRDLEKGAKPQKSAEEQKPAVKPEPVKPAFIAKEVKEAVQEKPPAAVVKEAKVEEKQSEVAPVEIKPESKPVVMAQYKEQKPFRGAESMEDVMRQGQFLKNREDESKAISEIRRKARQRELDEKLKVLQEKGLNQGEKDALAARGPITKEALLRKLTRISPKEEAERERFLARVSGKERQSFSAKDKESVKEIVFRPVVSKPSGFERIIVRVIAVLLAFALFFVAIYLLFQLLRQFNRSSNVANPATTTLPEVVEPVVDLSDRGLAPEEGTSSESEILPETASSSEFEVSETVEPSGADYYLTNIAPDLIKFDRMKFPDSSIMSNPSDFYQEFLRETDQANGFTRILFQSNGRDNYLDFIDSLKIFGVLIPDDFVDKIDSAGNLFVFYGKKGPRFGFIAKVNDQSIGSSMKDWEGTMSNDLLSFASAFSTSSLRSAGTFKTAFSNGLTFRYLNYQWPELGICYSVGSDYLILTTSGEEMVEALKLLPSP